MKKFKRICKNKIVEEVNNSVPDVKAQIVCSIDWNKVKINNVKPVTRKKRIFQFVFLPCASMIAFCMAFVVPLMNVNFKNNTNNYVMTISINPCVEITANASQIVTSQKGLNEDGVLLLLKQNLVGQTMEQATNKIVELSNNMGYLTDGKNIRFAVKTDKGKVMPSAQAKLKKCIDTCVKGFKFDNLNVVNMSLAEVDDLEEYYEKNIMPAFEINILQEFHSRLVEITKRKLYDTNELLMVLEPYAKENNENIIPPFSLVRPKLEHYAIKYGYKLFQYNIGKLTYDNVSEIFEDLQDVSEDLVEVIQEVDVNPTNSQILDGLEDLFDMVKEHIKEEGFGGWMNNAA